jgi:hypothetical protein
MKETTIRRINVSSFVTVLTSIVLGVGVGILGVWGVIPREDGVLWKALASDAIVFVGAVLSNLAIACYKDRDGDIHA